MDTALLLGGIVLGYVLCRKCKETFLKPSITEADFGKSRFEPPSEQGGAHIENFYGPNTDSISTAYTVMTQKQNEDKASNSFGPRPQYTHTAMDNTGVVEYSYNDIYKGMASRGKLYTDTSRTV